MEASGYAAIIQAFVVLDGSGVESSSGGLLEDSCGICAEILRAHCGRIALFGDAREISAIRTTAHTSQKGWKER